LQVFKYYLNSTTRMYTNHCSQILQKIPDTQTKAKNQIWWRKKPSFW